MLENVTAEHIQTSESLFTFSTSNIAFTARNLTNNNVSLGAS